VTGEELRAKRGIARIPGHMICVRAGISRGRLSEETVLVDMDVSVNTTQEAMAEASAMVLGGPRLRSEAKVFRHPDQFQDERGHQMWQTVSDILVELHSSGFSLSYICTPRDPEPRKDSRNSEAPEVGMCPMDPQEVRGTTEGSKDPTQKTPGLSASAPGEQHSPALIAHESVMTNGR
jgi:hypothetical protein